MSLGPNALLPCGSESARRRHTALAEHCATCATEGRRTKLPSLSELVEARRRYLGALQGVAEPETRDRRQRALVLVGSDVIA